MILRLATIKDKEELEAYFQKMGVGIPSLEFCYVAEEDGKIVGAINAVKVSVLEMASDTPIIARRLYDMMNGALSVSGDKIIVYTFIEKVKKMLIGLGFIKHHDNITLFYKG